MEKEIANEFHEDEDIDLYSLWLILKKRRISIFLITLASVGIALVYLALAPKVYRVSNTLILNQMQGMELISQGEVIVAVSDLLGARKEKATLLLGMDEKGLGQITEIKASQIKGSSAIRVDISTLQKEAGIVLMEALPGYLQSSPNIKSMLNTQQSLMKRNREDMKAIIDNPMKGLKLSSNTFMYVSTIDLYTLREKYNSLNMAIDRMEKGQLISLAWKTELPKRHYKPNSIMTVLLGLGMGLVMGSIVAFLLNGFVKSD